MKIWVGVTDDDWFSFLRALAPDDVNFWQPSGSRRFKLLQPGEPFLLKLHSPRNFIVGGGFFVRYTALPCSLAWSAFGAKNGVADAGAFRARIRRYRRDADPGPDPTVGCNILTEPFFWREDEWIPVPADWAPNIVQGKSYDDAAPAGGALWQDVLARLALDPRLREIEDGGPRYGADYLARARLGQGAFRVLVTDAYQKRCAISGERTLPVLQAAHIQPYAAAGPHRVSNKAPAPLRSAHSFRSRLRHRDAGAPGRSQPADPRGVRERPRVLCLPGQDARGHAERGARATGGGVFAVA
jgi:putative restriction endonuclease